jgi:hypothetical protein
MGKRPSTTRSDPEISNITSTQRMKEGSKIRWTLKKGKKGATKFRKWVESKKKANLMF